MFAHRRRFGLGLGRRLGFVLLQPTSKIFAVSASDASVVANPSSSIESGNSRRARRKAQRAHIRAHPLSGFVEGPQRRARQAV
jgi:hypothetical protein